MLLGLTFSFSSESDIGGGDENVKSFLLLAKYRWSSILSISP
jgi:hypothetical protein